MILCKTKDGLVAEYALRDTNKSIGVAQYKLNEKLPANIQEEMPTIEDIEQNIGEKLKALENPVKTRLEIMVGKLAFLQQEELKAPLTFDLSCSLFDDSIRPLFRYLLRELSEIEPYFLSSSHYWTCSQNVDSLEELEKEWKNERQYRVGAELRFCCWFKGFKKAGVDSFDTMTQVIISVDQYHYGIRLHTHDHRPNRGAG